MKTDGEELIRKRAYELWERAGRPEGDGLKHWLEAAEEIQSARIDRGGERENGALSGDPIVSADPSEGKKPRKSAARKQQDDAKPKKNTASKARSKKS
ncbi:MULTISPECIES: DUF2934 domain-containing protein [unclassified Sinorhizobium]|uniref:DUF2934 domain-containing protein n=1 Tax=unclassified Sinorhizobium TaxID=2613772 RepID=UPI0024C42C81|nr:MULTISPECIES: DUF2934 domain-containing protein [unclassified Sinorhizobium]MDK1377276.1 DUF2934 domain-containing protein [Sinorhizobium sp. 6-70]MDK1481887.1 DUF2934 domain-containing protein [Sinorhizobium sp. 6-117]